MAMTARHKRALRVRRHVRVRKRISGTSARPRLSVFRSARHISAQVIDDTTGRTVAAASSVEPALRQAGTGGNIDAARAVGRLVAERATGAGVKQVVFDRGGYKYHGRVAAMADAARQAGLEF
ncbi:MAG: 50S ribosomal protein L18 [Acidimicrobiales bacterium]